MKLLGVCTGKVVWLVKLIGIVCSKQSKALGLCAKILVTLIPGVNFINILLQPFSYEN